MHQEDPVIVNSVEDILPRVEQLDMITQAIFKREETKQDLKSLLEEDGEAKFEDADTPFQDLIADLQDNPESTELREELDYLMEEMFQLEACPTK